MSGALVRYHTAEGWRAAIAFTGRKVLHAVYLTDGGVRHDALPKSEERHMVPIAGNVKRAAKTLRRCGKSFGISKAARRFLREESVA